MTVTEELQKGVRKALEELGIESGEVSLEHPDDMSYGDYSTNVALQYAKEVKMSPKELAAEIVGKLKVKSLKFVDKVEVAGPGFINFTLKPEFFRESINGILRQAEDYGKNKILAGRKIMVEYTDPNPFKPFHIGHLMSNAIGESIARLIEAEGAEVKRACWQGDVGLHVAKAIWGFTNNPQPTTNNGSVEDWGKAYVLGAEKYETDEQAKKEINDLNKVIFDRSDDAVNKVYEEGRKISLEHFEEIYKKVGTKFDYYFFEGKEGREGEPIVREALGKNVFEESDLPAPRPNTFVVYAILCEDDSIYIGQTSDLQRRWKEHRDGIGAEYFKTHKPVKLIHHEEYKGRDEAVKREHDLKTGFGREWLKREWKAGRTRQAGGAIVYKGEKVGLHTRVFITSKGLPTYETKEFGLNKAKFEKEPDLDESIIITANEQSDYFKVVLAAMDEVMPNVAEKTKHIAHGMLRIPSGKMSSRKGNVITGESLIEQVKEMVQEKIKDRDLPEKEKETIAEQVAIGAIKYSILRSAVGGDIIYDFEKSISFEGDSGPYLQYAHTRAKSVLAKAEGERIPPFLKEVPELARPNKFSEKFAGARAEDFSEKGENPSAHQNEPLPLEKGEVTVLERLLVRFPEIVERAGNPSSAKATEDKEYAPHHVVTYLTELAGAFNGWYAKGKIVDANDPNSPYKVALTEAFAITIKNGLWLLGIQAPEKM